MPIRQLFVLLFTLAFCTAGCSRRATPETLAVGHLAALSGPDKAMGEQEKQAIALAVEEANKADGQVAGRTVKVLHVDTKGDPEIAQREAVRLLRVNGAVALLAGATTAEAEQVGKAAQPYGIAVLSPTCPTPAPGGDNVICLGIAPGPRGQMLARYTAQDLKLQRVAVVSDTRRPAHAAVATAFVGEFPKSADYRLDEWTFATESERTTLVERLVKLPLQALLVACDGEGFLRLRKQLVAAGFKGTLLYGGPETELPIERVEGESVVFATAYAGEDKKEGGDGFAQAYWQKFKKTPDVNAILAYDRARLLFDAMRRAKSSAGIKIREELTKAESFDGVTGTLTFGKDCCVRRTVYVVRLEKGQVQLLRSYAPGGK